jgi:hypothetical protein
MGGSLVATVAISHQTVAGDLCAAVHMIRGDGLPLLRVEGVVVAHIYPRIGILTHDLSALRKSTVEYFPSFW